MWFVTITGLVFVAEPQGELVRISPDSFHRSCVGYIRDVPIAHFQKGRVTRTQRILFTFSPTGHTMGQVQLHFDQADTSPRFEMLGASVSSSP